VGKVKTGLTQIDYTFDFSIPGVQAFSLNEEGQLVITDSNGEPHTLTPPNQEGQGNEGNWVVVFPLTVQDKEGNIYQVEKVPDPANPGKEIAQATSIGKAGAALAAGSFDPSQLDGNKAIVTFEKGANVYGFDTWQPYYDKVVLIREKYQRLYQDANGPYYAPWKLLPTGKSEGVTARILIKDTSIDPKKVIFKTPKSTEFQAAYDSTTKSYQLWVVAGPAGDAQEVYALYPRGQGKYYTWASSASITSYAPQSYKVVLVPVEGAPVEEQAIRQALEQVYGPAAISWQIEKAPNFAYAGNANLMSSSTGLATYNADMKALNQAYRQALGAQFDPKANYLFFLKATGATTVNDRDATGFMPRGAQFGYLFTSEIEKAKQATTVAHELGHGRWKLFHTFDKHYGGFQRQQTNNVMDYADGHHLAKWQWDLVHDPAMLVSIFEGDDKSADLRTNGLPKELLNGTTYNFITPTGKKITLPQNCVVSFHFGLSSRDQIGYPIGYLHNFEIVKDNKEVVAYSALISNGVFKGYYDANNQPYPQTLTNQDKNDNLILFVPEKEGVRFIKYQASLTAFVPDEAILDYASFPIQPYLRPTKLKESALAKYDSIRSLIQHQNEDWTLHKDFFSKALQLHNNKAEHALIVKIVELRTAYRALFEQFTDPQCYEAWTKSLQKPGTTTSPYVPTPMVDCSGAWEQILRQDPQRLTLRESNPVEFYRLFLSEFIKYIQTQSLIKQNFLATLSLSTPQREATDFLQLCSNEEVTSIPWEKRQILLQVLTKDKLPEKLENAVLRLIAYTPVGERQLLLTFLADEIKFTYIFDQFDDFLGEDNFSRVVTLLSSFIEAPKPYQKAYQQALAPNPAYVNIDLDLLGNKQTSGYYFDEANNIHFYNEVRQPKTAYDDPRIPAMTRDEEFLTVPYNQTIPVQFWSTFDLVEGKVYQKKEVVSLPALYVAFLLEKGNNELFSKKAWLVADGVMLLVGVGEVKLVFSGASWIRKAMLASSIIGSVNGIVVETLPSSVISDQLRNRLRMLNLVLTLPEAARGLTTLGKGIVKELRTARQNTDVVTGQKIEDLALDLERSLGGADEVVDLLKDFFGRLDRLGLTELKGRVAALDQADQLKFADDFANAADDVLHSFNTDVNLVNSWKVLDDAGSSLKTNMQSIKKINFLKSKGLTDVQLINIAKLNNSKYIDFAESISLRNDFTNSINSNLDEIIVDASICVNKFGLPNFVDDLTRLVSNPNHKGIEQMKSWLSEFKKLADDGYELELQVALRQSGEVHLGYNPQSNGQVVMVGNKAVDVDVYNASLNAFIECKRVSSPNFSKFRDRLLDIGSKFNSETKLPSIVRDVSGRNLFGYIHVKESSVFKNGLNTSKQDIITSIKNNIINNANASGAWKDNVDGLRRLDKIFIQIENNEPIIILKGDI